MCVTAVVTDIHQKVQMTTQKIQKSWIQMKFMTVTSFNITNYFI